MLRNKIQQTGLLNRANILTILCPRPSVTVRRFHCTSWLRANEWKEILNVPMMNCWNYSFFPLFACNKVWSPEPMKPKNKNSRTRTFLSTVVAQNLFQSFDNKFLKCKAHTNSCLKIYAHSLQKFTWIRYSLFDSHPEQIFRVSQRYQVIMTKLKPRNGPALRHHVKFTFFQIE